MSLFLQVFFFIFWNKKIKRNKHKKRKKKITENIIRLMLEIEKKKKIKKNIINYLQQ